MQVYSSCLMIAKINEKQQILMKINAVYTYVNGNIAHLKQQISELRFQLCCTLTHRQCALQLKFQFRYLLLQMCDVAVNIRVNYVFYINMKYDLSNNIIFNYPERLQTEFLRSGNYLMMTISQMAKDTAIVTTECEQETVSKLFNGTIFNYLE